MPSLDNALGTLAAGLSQREEVRRLAQAKARMAADPEAGRALSAFITECYTRARAAGAAGPSAVDAAWLTAQRQSACRNPLVQEYLEAHEAIMRLLATVMQQLQGVILGPDRAG